MKIFFVFVIAGFSFIQLSAQQPEFTLNEQKIDSLLANTYPDSLPGISIGIIQSGKTVYKKKLWHQQCHNKK